MSVRTALLLASILTTRMVFATTFTWNSGVNNGAWNNTADWSPTGFPATGDVAVFSSIPLGGTTVQLTTPAAVNQIQFSFTNAQTVNISGSSTNTLAIDNGGSITVSGVSNFSFITITNSLINTSFTFNQSSISQNITMESIGETTPGSAFTKTGTGSLFFSGSATYSGATTVSQGTLVGSATNAFSPNSDHTVTGTLALNNFSQAIGSLAGAGSVTLGSGTLTTGSTLSTTFSGGISGSGGLTKVGSTTFKLAGGSATNYSGATTVSAGTLQAGAINAFSPNSDHTVNATLDLNSFAQSIGAIAGSGTVTLGSATLTLGSTTSTTFSGTFGGTGGLIYQGSGTLVLSGTSSTYSGGTTLNSGTLSISADANLGSAAGSITFGGGTLAITSGFTSTRNVNLSSTGIITVSPSQVATFSGQFTGSGGLTANGTGTLGLSGTTNNYSGATTVSGGTLAAGQMNAFSPNSDHTVNGTLLLNNFPQTIGAIAGSGAVTLGSATLTVGSTSSTTFSGAFGGTGGLIYQGAGTLVLSGASSTYSGGTTLKSGTVSISADANLGSAAGSITFAGSGGTLAVTSGLTSARNIALSSTGTFSVSSAQLATFSGQIIGTGGLIVNGLGTLSLSGATNSYSGGTTLNSGTLSISADANLGSAAGSITFAGGTLAITSALTSTRNVNLSSTGIITVSSSQAATFSGQFTGSGGLTANGSGTLGLSGATNNYSGATTVSTGTLAAGAMNAFSSNSDHTVTGTLALNNFSQTIGSLAGSGAVTLGSGTLTTGAKSSTTFSGGITGTGGLIKTGATTFQLSGGGANTYSGATSVSVGTLQGGAVNAFSVNSDHTVTGTLDLNNNAQAIGSLAGVGSVTLGSGTLTTGSTSSTTFSGGINGTGGLTKVGSTTFQLAGGGASTYSGPTTVSVGTLQGGATNAFSPNSDHTVTGTLDLNNNPQAIGSLSGAGSVTLGSGTLTTGSRSSTAFSGGITGTGGLIKTGATTFQLSGGGANTYSGATSVNVGTLQGGAVNAFSVNSDHTVAGTLDLNNSSQAIGSLAGSGSVTLGSGTLTTGSKSSTTFSGGINGSGGLTKVGSTTFQLAGASASAYSGATTVSVGTLQGGATNAFSPNSDHTVTGTLDLNNFSQTIASLAGAGSVTLGSGTLTTGSSSSTIFSGGINGTGGLTKVGATTFQLAGGGASAYSGPTTVSVGTLQGGNTNAFSPNSNHTLASGTTLDLNSFSQTIGSLAGPGNVLLGSGTLTTGSTTSTTFSGNISETGALIKTGATTFILTGTNSYSGGTTVSGGVLQGNTLSLQGNIANTATVVFDQATTGSYTGAMTGTGTLTKQNNGNLILSGSVTSGTTNVNAGRLSVNNSLSSAGGVTVASSATLGGTGTITAPVIVNGTISPGNSIGTLNIVGNVAQSNNSTLAIEVDPTTASLLNITGSYTIGTNDTLSITVDPGIYPPTKMYTIVAASSGVAGQFSTVTLSRPTFKAVITYDPNDIVLTEISTVPFSNVVIGGNAGAVAACLDTLTAPSGSDLEIVLAELRMIPTTDELQEALALLQPSQFTALALAQENTTLYIKDTLFQRLYQGAQICSPLCNKILARTGNPERPADYFPSPEQEPVDFEQLSPVGSKRKQKESSEKNRGVFWVAPFGGLSHQRHESDQVGYSTGAGGLSAGVDFNPSRAWTFGGALGYSHVYLDWERGRGHSNMNNGYAALYASLVQSYAYLLGSVMGSYNHYSAARNIDIASDLLISLDRTAKSSHHGFQGSGHIQGGLLFGKKVRYSPFVELDYIYVHESSFNEHGAQSLDLDIKAKNSDFLQGEAGVEISRCFSVSGNRLSPWIGFSLIREWRFIGKHMRSSFENSSCVMHTTGMNPDRTLYSPTVGFTVLLPDESQTLSFGYKGKFGNEFRDNRLLAQFLMRF